MCNFYPNFFKVQKPLLMIITKSQSGKEVLISSILSIF